MMMTVMMIWTMVIDDLGGLNAGVANAAPASTTASAAAHPVIDNSDCVLGGADVIQ